VKLQHVTVPIPRDGAEAGRRFYGGLLGLEERDVLPELDPAQFVWFRLEGDQELHLMLSDDPPHAGQHFCLELTEVEELRASLEAAGVATRTGTRVVGRTRFTCRDPFGNLIELARLE
jgi:catechol 2,3-dioxygenase-like lactoylglutathione lyase family enzyme